MSNTKNTRNIDHSARKPCSGGEISRRHFFESFSIVVSSVWGVLLAVTGIGFVVGPLWHRVPRVWRTIGNVDDFKIGETVNVVFQDSSPLPWAGVTANTAAWLRRQSESEFIAFTVNCTHLGCPVRWLPDANLFMCPCHGGVYYSDGRVAAGPPPKPLHRYAVRIHAGKVQLQTRPIPIA